RAARDLPVRRCHGEVPDVARSARLARGPQRAADGRRRQREIRCLGTRKAGARMSGRSVPGRAPDRVVTSVGARRSTILDVIRAAKRSIALTLFRCNDAEVFAELARADARGVQIEALITPRAKGGRQKLRKLWRRLEECGANVHTYSDAVVKYHAKYLVADDGPAVIASCNFTRKCFERTCDVVVVTYDVGVVSGLRALMAADRDGLRAPETVTERLVIGPERARRQLTN